MKAAPLQIVEVEWIDSTMMNKGGWLHPEEDELPEAEDLIYRSVGFVLREDADVLVLALSVDSTGEDQANGVLAIPKVAVRDRRTLRSSRPKRET